MFDFKRSARLIRNYKVFPFAFAVVASAVLVACGSGGGSGDTPVAVVVTTPPAAEIAARARYAVIFVNAQDGKIITDPLTVTFTGQTPLVDFQNKPLNNTTINTSDGQVALGAQFSATNTEFSVLAGNPAIGWANTGTSIVGSTASSGDQTIQLKMLNTKNAAAITADPAIAISAKVTEVANFNDSTTVTAVNKTVINNEGVAETVGGAALTIPAATKAVDPKTGATVATTGALTVSTTKFSNSEPRALAAFPGGFAASVTVPASATFTVNPTGGASGAGGAFITGGFAQFNVTDSTGKALTQFDKPLAISIDLPKSSLGAGGEPIVAGSKYPVWSFNDATGGWIFEKEGIVSEKSPMDPNSFTVAFETNHLSSWNLDFFSPARNLCDAKINLQGKGSDVRPLFTQVVGASGQRFQYTTVNFRDPVVTIPAVLQTAIANVKVYDGDQEVGNVTGRLCIPGGLNVPVNLPTIVPASKGTLIVDVTRSCPNGTLARALPAAVIYRSTRLSSRLQYYPSDLISTTTIGNVARSIFTGKDAGPAEIVVSGIGITFPTQSIMIPSNSTVTVTLNSPTLTCATVTGAS